MRTFIDWLIWFSLGVPAWYAAYRVGRWARLRRVLPQRKPLCPQCGYNMTGLSEARCPECGRRFTLEQLWSAWVRAYVGVEDENEL